MDNDNLDAIIEYGMSPLEAQAYKIGLLWLELRTQVFPNYKHGAGFSKKGDPRKSALFKYCYKLVRETQGLIKDNQYKLYIKAQLDVLRAINMNNLHPLIEPAILVGDKAWVRWKLWKKKYEMVGKRETKEDAGLDQMSSQQIRDELTTTKKFLMGKYGDLPKEEQIFMACKDIERWVSLGKVSPLYCLLSPWVRKHCQELPLSAFEVFATAEAQQIFNELFPHEV